MSPGLMIEQRYRSLGMVYVTLVWWPGEEDGPPAWHYWLTLEQARTWGQQLMRACAVAGVAGLGLQIWDAADERNPKTVGLWEDY